MHVSLQKEKAELLPRVDIVSREISESLPGGAVACKSNTPERIYFPNLNGLRFFAAFAVIVHHVEQYKAVLGYNNWWHVPFVKIVGNLGVVLFFVLSGFLITFLLLKEKAHTGTISVSNFYKRRILRIWPLYYLVVLPAFFVWPYIPSLGIPGLSEHLFNRFETKLLLFALFLPNLANSAFRPVPFASQAWSVGVEEQFYFIWPWLVKYARRIPLMLGLVAILCVLAKGILTLWYGIGAPTPVKYLLAFWRDFNIDCMALGGLAACCLHQDVKKVLNLLFSKVTQILTYLLVALLIGFGASFSWLNQEVYAVLFAIIILNCAANPSSVLRLELAPFRYLGKVSYGLYMYHSLVIVIVLKTLGPLGWSNSLLLYLVCTLVTTLVAAFSYELFESWFIRQKVKHSAVLSGENVQVVRGRAA